MSETEKKLANNSGLRREEVNESTPAESKLNEILLSSQTRLRIAELISRRPRTLRELSRLTGVSIPGVLRHIEAMRKAGLIHEERLGTRALAVRKLYSLKGMRVMDFSVGDLTIFKVAKDKPGKERDAPDFDSLALEIFAGRRRIKDKAKRLARAINELIESERILARKIDDLELTDEERFILLTVFTEETVDDAERVLTRTQGMKEARRSIDEALARTK